MNKVNLYTGLTWKERVIRATKVAATLNELNVSEPFTATDIIWLNSYLNGEIESDDPVLRSFGFG